MNSSFIYVFFLSLFLPSLVSPFFLSFPPSSSPFPPFMPYHLLPFPPSLLSPSLPPFSLPPSLLSPSLPAFSLPPFSLPPCFLSPSVMNKLADLFYLCAMMMGRGNIRVRAIIHGILMNTLNSLLSIPKVNENGAFTRKYIFHLFHFHLFWNS